MTSTIQNLIYDIETYSSFEVIYNVSIGSKALTLGKELQKLPLNPVLADHLWFKGIKKLYLYQEQALETILSKVNDSLNNVIITAPTGMGKTEAFLLPILTKIATKKNTQKKSKKGVDTIIIYPTKALALDQYEKIMNLAEVLDITVAKIDGDVKHPERQKIVGNPPDILITNPDMIHYHLGQSSISKQFKAMFSSLETIIIDELHYWSGTLGSHLKMILERLSRFSSTKKLQFIGSSATLANAKSFATEIFQTPVKHIFTEENKGIVNVLIVWPTDKPNKSFAELISVLKKNKYRMLVFENSHRSSEEIYNLLKTNHDSLAIHRGGLAVDDRIAVEEKLRSSELTITVTTPTLELGIDIGSIDAIITPPVSNSRILQRIGRAGRQGQEALAIIRLNPKDPISQFYKKNPEMFLQNLTSLYIAKHHSIIRKHLLAAAFDSPILKSEKFYKKYIKHFSNLLNEIHDSGNRISLNQKGKSRVSQLKLRGNNFQIEILDEDTKKILGTRSMPYAMFELYNGALYSHGGEFYSCKSLTLDLSSKKGKSVVKKTNRRIHTVPLYENKPILDEPIENRKTLNLDIIFAEFSIINVILGYIRIDKKTTINDSNNQKNIIKIDPPLEYKFNTTGFICQFPDIQYLTEINNIQKKVGSYHAINHLIKKVAAPFVGSNTDIQVISLGHSGAIIVYDTEEGGNGFSESILNQYLEVLNRAYKLVKQCKCKEDNGCPFCIQSFSCGNNNQPLSKEGAIILLENVLKKENKYYKLSPEVFSHKPIS